MAGTQISLLCFVVLEQLMLGAAAQWFYVLPRFFDQYQNLVFEMGLDCLCLGHCI